MKTKILCCNCGTEFEIEEEVLELLKAKRNELICEDCKEDLDIDFDNEF